MRGSFAWLRYARGVEYRFGERTVACTHVERVMFPADGITKGELLAYYHDVAPLMVPELRGRPLSVVRYTKGIDQKGFFQKHYQKHFPAWLDQVTAGSKTKVAYPIVDDAAGVVYLANQGSIEFHVWTSRKDAPDGAVDRPDVLVFDLDPPDGGFALVRDAARIVHALCDELALPAFVKTTGSKGLHVAVPLDGAARFGEVGALAGRLGQLLCRRHPELLTMEFYKKDRQGRLFVDMMRNAPGATWVAAYSLRGRPGAPLSAPITWDELEAGARIEDFDLFNMPARIAAVGDLWAPLLAPGGRFDLAPLLRSIR